MSHHEVAIVFLNNVGVTLLQRQQYQESITTFQDAMRIFRHFMMMSSSPNQSTEEEEIFYSMPPNDETMMIRAAVLRATERLSYQAQKFGESIVRQSRDWMTDPMIVLDVANDDCFSTILRYEAAIDQIDFVIRMSENAPPSSTASNWKLQYSIVLQNFAVVYKRFSEIPNDEYEISDEWRDALYEKSSCLFHEANDTISDTLAKLSSNINMRSGPCGNDQILHILYALMVSMFTTSQMCDIMHRNQTDYEAIQYYAQFQKSHQSFRLLAQEYRKRSSGITSTTHDACA